MFDKKLLIRENGDKVMIDARYYDFNNTYIVTISVCEKGKRKFILKTTSNEFEYRKLPFGGKEREIYELNYQLKFVTKNEILEAKIRCWNLMNPVMD